MGVWTFLWEYPGRDLEVVSNVKCWQCTRVNKQERGRANLRLGLHVAFLLLIVVELDVTGDLDRSLCTLLS